MISVEHQQRATGRRIQHLGHRAEQGIGVARVAGILRDRLRGLVEPALPVGIMRLHGHRHDQQLFAGREGFLDLAGNHAPDGCVADIGAEAVGIRKGVLADESLEAHERHRPVAAEEARVMGMDENRSPSGRAQLVRQREPGDTARAQIGIEPVHALVGEGAACQHLDFGAMGVGAEAGDLEPPRREGARFQPIKVWQIQPQALPAQIAEGFRLDDDDRLVVGDDRITRRHRTPVTRRTGLGPPEREPHHQRHAETDVPHHRAGRSTPRITSASRQRASEAPGGLYQQAEASEGGREQPRLHGGAERAGLKRTPQEDHPGEEHRENRQTRRFRPAKIEQGGMPDQRANEGEIAEHQRLAQIVKLDAGNGDEHRQRDEAGHDREVRARRQPQPKQPEAKHDHSLHQASGTAGWTNGWLRQGTTVQNRATDHQKAKNPAIFDQILHHEHFCRAPSIYLTLSIEFKSTIQYLNIINKNAKIHRKIRQIYEDYTAAHRMETDHE